MIKKLELFSVCINKDNTQVFPSLYDFLCANEFKLTDNVKCDIAKLRNDTGTFPKWMTQTTGFIIPFMPCLQSIYRYVYKRASSKLQQAVLWKCKWIRSHCQSILPFATTYLCASGFSALTSMKTKYRHRLCVENYLRLRLYRIQPNIAELCASFHAHPFH